MSSPSEMLGVTEASYMSCFLSPKKCRYPPKCGRSRANAAVKSIQSPTVQSTGTVCSGGSRMARDGLGSYDRLIRTSTRLDPLSATSNGSGVSRLNLITTWAKRICSMLIFRSGFAVVRHQAVTATPARAETNGLAGSEREISLPELGTARLGYVASLSQGAAVNHSKSAEIRGFCCEPPRHGMGRVRRTFENVSY